MSARVVVQRGNVTVAPISWPAAHDAGTWPIAGQPEDVPGAGNQNTEIAALKRENAELRRAVDCRLEEAIGRGRTEGEGAARKALSQQLDTEVARVSKLMNALIAAGPKLRQRAEEDMVRLAVAIARRVLHREITVDNDALLGLVKAAFGRIDQREIVLIRTDATSMGAMQRIIQTLDPSCRINLVMDATLTPGSLILETTRGRLDASVDTQLEEIQRGFTDFVKQARY